MSPASTRIETNFRLFKAYHFLKGLATTPYDLTATGNLSTERLESYCAQAGEFKLLYATERVNEDVLNALQELAQEARLIEKMESMQRGDVINKIEGYPSENRTVLHTAMRDLFMNPNSGAAAKKADSQKKKSAKSSENLSRRLKRRIDLQI